MCIIVAKPMGVEMPDENILERCFWSNPDGSGFMFADGKSVRIRKGFMEFDDFLDALEYETAGFDLTETGVVMHFRIATHGKVKPECCHPFPISDKPEELRATSIDSRWGVAHNGVIDGRMTNESWSDTMDFVAEVMRPLSRMNPSFMRSSDALDLLEGACQSKLAIIDNSGEISTVGKFYENEGVLYSNTSYVRSVWQYSDYSRLWSGAAYEAAYGTTYEQQLTLDDDPDWENIEKLMEYLPWEACKECALCEECALYFPECETENMAAQAAAYYNGIDEKELDGMVLE